jgi:hypothetical protein
MHQDMVIIGYLPRLLSSIIIERTAQDRRTETSAQQGARIIIQRVSAATAQRDAQIVV